MPAAPQEEVWDPPLPLYLQERAAGCCRSTYHCCGQAGKRVGTAQGGDADSLEQTDRGEGSGRGRGRGEGRGGKEGAHAPWWGWR